MASDHTVKELLQNDFCPCLKKDTHIFLTDCECFNCGRWKSCMKKTNNRYDKEEKNVKKQTINS